MGDARQNGRFHVHGAPHAKGGAVVFVEHQPIEAHGLGVDFFIEIAVVQLRPQLRVINVVADGQIHDRLAGGAKVARFWVLIRPLGEVSDEHGPLL